MRYMRSKGFVGLVVLSVLLLVSVSLLLLEGCSRGAPERGKVGMILKTLKNPFFIEMKGAAETRARELGIKLIVRAPEHETDVATQFDLVDGFIQQGVDVLIIDPNGSSEIIPAIQKANEAGIPVIIVDTRVNEEEAKRQGVKYVTFIGSDNYEGGKLAAEYMAKALGGKGKVAILEGIPGHETADQRLRGFRDTIKNYPNIKVVASQPANWERALAYDVTQNILTAHPDINGIFACNDMMALGALEAVAQMNKLDQVVIVGFDAIEDALKEIKSGRMEATIAQHPEEMGVKAVDIAKQIIDAKKQGKPIEQLNIPKEIITPIELVTRDNVDEIIREKRER